MSTDLPPRPDDEIRAHAMDPAEGDDATPETNEPGAREHSSEPAEGEDVAGD